MKQTENKIKINFFFSMKIQYEHKIYKEFMLIE